MIEISFSTQGQTLPHRFDKETIVIGDGPPEAVDISFPGEGFHLNHLKIILQEKEYWVLNQANDPFVILNHQPFWKKKLQVGDEIQLRTHLIKIEAINFEKEAISYPERLIKPAPFLEEDQVIEKPAPIKEIPPVLKQTTKAPPHSSHKKKLAKVFVLLAGLTMLTVALTFSEIYFRTSSKIDREEMLAAESLSDYAMALQYAKVYHIAQQKQNWIDPQFLKNNLVDLLSTTALPCGNIDAQGQFSNCPYILRFYTNRDFSRFLLIAQPDANFAEWILPKKTLIVDSSLMEVHRTDDLRNLNRLLSYPTPLDGANGEEIKRAILQMDIISLTALAKETGKEDFAPPIALSYMKPGTENLIYNAPRYHQFGETFLKKAIALAEDKFNPHELTILQGELDTLAKFHDLIFYSSDGLNQAFKGHRALQKLVIPSNYFTGYLIYSKDGSIIRGRLIVDDDILLSQEMISEDKNIAESATIAQGKDTGSNDHPLKTFLLKQAEMTQEEVGPIIQNLYIILEDVLEKDSFFLPPTFKQLIDEYEKKAIELGQSLRSGISDFKKNHPMKEEVSIDHLLREYGLLDFYSEDNSISSEQQWKAYRHLMDIGRDKSWKDSREHLLPH